MRQHVLSAGTLGWDKTSILTDLPYAENISYDANGNITGYERNGPKVTGLPLKMDNLTYKYNTATDPLTGQEYKLNNRLDHVEDLVTTDFKEDIETQAAEYYKYDRIGNLIREGGDKIEWTVYGKIRTITKQNGDVIEYSYDPGGNRVKKTVKPAAGGVTTTWYVRDAQGNILALYSKKDTDPLKWKEQHLYGSSRIGMWQPNVDVETTNGQGAWGTEGNRSFELTNHLGNVLAVVTDKRTIGPDGIYSADVSTVHDYYPFGMQMPGRSIDWPNCQEIEQDLRKPVISSDLESGVVAAGENKYTQNGITWQNQVSTIVTWTGHEIRCENKGLSGSEGLFAIVPIANFKPNTTYVMEFDITGKSPEITEFFMSAQSNTNDPYLVGERRPAVGRQSIIFKTGTNLGTFVGLRLSAYPQLIAGYWFTVDNFAVREYTVVNEDKHYTTDFSEAVTEGTDVNDKGQKWKPFTPSSSGLSLSGTTDKKLQINCTNQTTSRIYSDFTGLQGGGKYVVKFSQAQSEADKRTYIALSARTGTNGWVYFQQGIFYTGSGDYQYNFTMPDGKEQLRVEFLRQNTGGSWDGLTVPYTIDNFSLVYLDPVATQKTTVCDPGASSGGENTIYRYGFNGKENDNEVKGNGNQQDYGMRIYDPRLGRFLSVDPLTRNFAWNAPYAYAENSPIKFIDLEGAEKWDPTSKPTGITHIQRATVPIHPVDAQTNYSIKAGPYQLYPVTDPSGKRNSYWLARYTYTEGPYAGMYRDDWIVGVDGVFDFVKKGKEYHNRAGWIEVFGGANQAFNLSSIGKGYQGVMSNPINWIAGAGILAASYKGLLRGTLSNAEAREWYLTGEAEIPNLVNTKLPLEEQAKQAFSIRNQLRTDARELMADRKEAARLNLEEPNMTWEQVVTKYKGQGFEGDALWKKIIESSQKSRKAVNERLGVKPKK